MIEKTVEQLEEYFAGRRRQFTLPVRFAGSPFQCMVWEELMKIPYGATISYAELAARTGNPRGVRAVASAIARNAVSIIVPCHRVTGSNKCLGGYAGGRDAKLGLLTLEAEIGGTALPLF